MQPSLSFSKELLTGKIVGHGSLFYEGINPVDNKDPLIQREDNFVLLLENNVYYFMHNIPRSLKIKYYKNEVTVVGWIDKYYRSINVEKIKVIKNGKYKTVWDSRRIEDNVQLGP